MKCVDPATAKLLIGALACILLAGWQARSRDSRAGSWQGIAPPGRQIAARGCLDADLATAEDWRQVPGVTRKTAQLLAEVCPATRTCAPDGPQVPVRGVGPATRAKIVQMLCRRT